MLLSNMHVIKRTLILRVYARAYDFPVIYYGDFHFRNIMHIDDSIRIVVIHLFIMVENDCTWYLLTSKIFEVSFGQVAIHSMSIFPTR